MTQIIKFILFVSICVVSGILFMFFICAGILNQQIKCKEDKEEKDER